MRTFGVNYAEPFADTPEPLDRTDGRQRTRARMGRVLADVINKALRYMLNDVDDS